MKILCLLTVFLTISTGLSVPEPVPSIDSEPKPPAPKVIGAIVLPEPNPQKVEPQPVPPPAEQTPKNITKVKKDLFEVSLELEGVIESITNTPIQVLLKEWSELSLLEAVDHGTRVKKGDVILRFHSEKLEKEIEEQEAASPLAKIRLESATSELELLEKKTPLLKESNRRSRTEQEDDFAYFDEVGRPQNERNARETLKNYQNNLAYTEEELKQLKKMYENDDMTEETEEIILKRAQDSVDSDRWELEQIKTSTERSLNVTIPREHQSLKRSLQLKQLDWEVEAENMERNLGTKGLEVEQLKRNLAKSAEKLEALKIDLMSLTVKAPHDGIIYYGDYRNGKWITAPAMETKLVPGGKATSHEVLLTVVDPETLQVRAKVEEDKLKDLKKDQAFNLTLKWNEDVTLKSKVESINYIPDTTSTFHTILSINQEARDFPVNPGMKATLRTEVYRNENALMLPVKAVKKSAGKAHVIMKDGTKRTVKTGRSNSEDIEIIEGLKEGDEVEADISAKSAPEK